jgi:hypothetical protein
MMALKWSGFVLIVLTGWPAIASLRDDRTAAHRMTKGIIRSSSGEAGRPRRGASDDQGCWRDGRASCGLLWSGDSLTSGLPNRIK